MTGLIQSYHSKCLQADLPGAIRVLRGANGSSSKRSKAFFRKVGRRFLSRDEARSVRCPDKLVTQVILAYREYYRESLLALPRKELFERILERDVRQIARGFGLKVGKSQSWASIETMLTKEFRRRGYRALFGKVTPFRSLLVWKSEKKRSYRVPLVSGSEKVSVVLLDGFVDLGWLHYATFGRYYVGGWAKREALYCVLQAYKRNFKSEAFRVSYLTHEAQHFSDYRNFPGLSQADLEYRAKLAELVASRRPARLMKKFAAEAKNDPELPHCYAAFRILQEVGPGLKGSKISQRARVCLNGHFSKQGASSKTTR